MDIKLMILEAEKLIRPFIGPTMLVRSAFLSQWSGAEVWLKLENQQPTGSFKVRGALNKIGRLSEVARAKGIVAASAGNHALGVAFAAEALGLGQVDIFVPETAPQAKVAKIEQFSVNLHLAGQSYEAAQVAATSFATDRGGMMVSAYDDVAVVAGQGTIGLEIFRQLPTVDRILVPVGGGGMVAGVGVVAQMFNPECQVVGVQPEASPAALFSLRDGQAYDPYEHEPTIADGLAGGFGQVPFEVAGDLIGTIWLASEEEMRRAIFTLVDRHQLVVEASGAIAITPLLRRQPALVGRTVVCVLSGGNLDTVLLREVLEEFK